MTPFATLLEQGTANAWLFIPSAILLGALHGLEPGHSKTMMAAFIVAIRGTVTQAVLLGLSATASHTAIVWLIAMTGLYFGGAWNNEAVEPYLQLISGVIIIAVALWMAWRTWRGQGHAAHDREHHAHGPEVRRIDTGHGVFMLELFEDGAPPRWRLLSVASTANRSRPRLSASCSTSPGQSSSRRRRWKLEPPIPGRSGAMIRTCSWAATAGSKRASRRELGAPCMWRIGRASRAPKSA